MRTGGAAMLARRGVNPFRIQSLGRWKSPLVVHYAGEALSTGLARELATASAPLQPAPSDLDSLRQFIHRLDQRLAALETIDVPQQPPLPADSTTSRSLILNPTTRTYHATLMPLTSPPERLKASCGWKFATQKHSVCIELPSRVSFTSLCSRCLYLEREAARAAELSDID